MDDIRRVRLQLIGGPYDGHVADFPFLQVWEGNNLFHNIVSENLPVPRYVHYRVFFSPFPHLSFVASYDGDCEADPVLLLGAEPEDPYTLRAYEREHGRGWEKKVPKSHIPEKDQKIVDKSPDGTLAWSTLPEKYEKKAETGKASGKGKPPKDMIDDLITNPYEFEAPYSCFTPEDIYSSVCAFAHNQDLSADEIIILQNSFGLCWPYTLCEAIGQLQEYTFYVPFDSNEVLRQVTQLGYSVANTGVRIFSDFNSCKDLLESYTMFPNGMVAFGMLPHDLVEWSSTERYGVTLSLTMLYLKSSQEQINELIGREL